MGRIDTGGRHGQHQDQRWLDATGHDHSDQLHVVPLARIPKYSTPWKFRLTLRQLGAELTEDPCDIDSSGARHHVAPFKDSK